MTNSIDLSPKDVNYLTSELLYNQFQNNSPNLTVASGVSFVKNPILVLDGSSRAFMSGKITITNATPPANMVVLNLPSNITIPNDYVIPVVVGRSGSFIFNAARIVSGGDGIGSVTIVTAGSYTTLPTITTSGNGSGAVFVVNMKAVSNVVATPQSSTGSYAPADTITLTGGTFTAATVLTVTNTLVESATITAGGTGGTTGTQTVTGTTGTGTKFQASVTIAGGAITAILSITVAGNYTVNPTTLTAEPVTGASLSGATLNIKMGVLTAGVTTPGNYTALPTNPVAQGSTSGSGTGATFTMAWGLLAINVTVPGLGYDSSSQIVISGAGGGVATIVLGSNEMGQVQIINAPNQNDVVYLNGIQFLTNSYTSK